MGVATIGARPTTLAADGVVDTVGVEEVEEDGEDGRSECHQKILVFKKKFSTLKAL